MGSFITLAHSSTVHALGKFRKKIEMKIKNRVIKSQNDHQSPEIPFPRKFFTLRMARFVLRVETLLGLLLT